MRLQDITPELLVIELRTLLAAQPGLDVFDSTPDARMDTDGRAHPYAAIWVSAGAWDELGEDIAATPGPRRFAFQVTAAGGDPARARRACQRVQAALVGARIGDGTIRSGMDAGPPIRDDAVQPARWYFPLQFTLT